MDQVAYAHYHLADRMQPLISDSHPSSFITTKVTNSRDSSRRAEAVGVRVLGYNIMRVIKNHEGERGLEGNGAAVCVGLGSALCRRDFIPQNILVVTWIANGE
jgi:hypothetical protein